MGGVVRWVIGRIWIGEVKIRMPTKLKLEKVVPIDGAAAFVDMVKTVRNGETTYIMPEVDYRYKFLVKPVNEEVPYIVHEDGWACLPLCVVIDGVEMNPYDALGIDMPIWDENIIEELLMAENPY